MAMTRAELDAKNKLMDLLGSTGRATYARMLGAFDLNLTSDPGVIAYIDPERARIVVNRKLRLSQASPIVRHEILHDFLKHMIRSQNKLIKDYLKNNPDVPQELAKIEAWDKRSPDIHEMLNIAGDYEISNKGYTEEDKEIIRNIYLNGQTLSGLVTEDGHPNWVNLSMEEIYDKLLEEKKNQPQMPQQPEVTRSDEYVDAYNEAIAKYGNLSEEELKDILSKL